MPEGNLLVFHWSFPLESRPFIQQSSRLTYWYPAAAIPLETKVSAICLMSVSFKLHWKVFHEFQPMGGRAPRIPLDPAAPPEPAPPPPAIPPSQWPLLDRLAPATPPEPVDVLRDRRPDPPVPPVPP